jgi:hypothetical protein
MDKGDCNFHSINEFENMMIDILSVGEKETWDEIEREKNAIMRCNKRKLFKQAIEKIHKNK